MNRTQEDTRVVDALYRLGSLIGNVQEPREALRFLLREVHAFFHAHSASIALVNPDTNVLELEVFEGLPEESRSVRLKIGEGITGWVALHGEPLLVPDVTQDARYVPLKPEVACEMAVPMFDNNAVIGVVNVDSSERATWDEQDLKTLGLLANEATRAVNRLWLIRQLRTKAEQLESLVSLSRRMVVKREASDLLKLVAREAREVMGCRLSAIFLLDPSESLLRLEAMSGSSHYPEYREDLRIEDSAVGTAIRRAKQVEVYNLSMTEEHHFVELVQNEGLVSMLSTPVPFEEQVLGVLNVYTDYPHRFNNDEKRIVDTLARLSAVAIQNARLYSRVFQSEDLVRKNEKLTTLGLLAAEIAHEIRNPLTVIKLLFESLDLDFPADDLRSKDVDVISEKLDQLEQIVTRVLSFGKSQEGLHARWELTSLVRDTLLLVRLKLEQSNIELTFERHEERIMVEASKGQLQQAMLNLIFNALQAMPDGGHLTLRTSVEPHHEQQVAVVEIGDTGPGVPQEIRNKIFDSFLSGHATGTGLGLSIVKRILKSHRGDIELRETGTEGTTFRMWLPLADEVE